MYDRPVNLSPVSVPPALPRKKKSSSVTSLLLPRKSPSVSGPVGQPKLSPSVSGTPLPRKSPSVSGPVVLPEEKPSDLSAPLFWLQKMKEKSSHFHCTGTFCVEMMIISFPAIISKYCNQFKKKIYKDNLWQVQEQSDLKLRPLHTKRQCINLECQHQLRHPI